MLNDENKKEKEKTKDKVNTYEKNDNISNIQSNGK